MEFRINEVEACLAVRAEWRVRFETAAGGPYACAFDSFVAVLIRLGGAAEDACLFVWTGRGEVSWTWTVDFRAVADWWWRSCALRHLSECKGSEGQCYEEIPQHLSQRVCSLMA